MEFSKIRLPRFPVGWNLTSVSQLPNGQYQVILSYTDHSKPPVVAQGNSIPEAILVSTQQLPQLDGLTAEAQLAAVKASQTSIIQAACQGSIVGGFVSSALGSPHTYGSLQTDQLNLLAAGLDAKTTPVSTFPVWCSNDSGVWELVSHTADQILQLNSDFQVFKNTQQVKYSECLRKIDNAINIDDVQSVVW